MSTPNLPQCPFPSIRRVVTGHSPSGKAIVQEDQVISPRITPTGGRFFDLFRTEEFPASNAIDFVDKIKQNPAQIVSKGGSTFRVGDVAPGAVVPLHRTISLDYIACLKGSIICELEDNVQVTLNSGDVLEQRGTVHAWINNTSEWARLLVVCEDALPVEVDGKTLPNTY